MYVSVIETKICLYLGEDYHQIPIERFDKADANYRGLWIQLENFVNPNGEKPEYPPFYCMVSVYIGLILS